MPFAELSFCQKICSSKCLLPKTFQRINYQKTKKNSKARPFHVLTSKRPISKNGPDPVYCSGLEFK